MDLIHLEAFYTIAKEKNFRKAAEKLHITQPAISSRISKLESALNTDLFHRNGRTVYLTQCGMVLEPFAKRILSLVREAREQVDQFQNKVGSRLEIGSTSRAGTYILPVLLEHFQILHPNIEIKVQTTPAPEIILEMLTDGAIDIALINKNYEDISYECIPLIQDRIMLVTSPNHALYQKYLQYQTVSIDSLNQCAIISFNHERTYYSPLFETLGESGSFHPKQFIFVDNVEAMKRMAVKNIGVAFLPKMAVQKEIKEGKLVEVPFYKENLITKQTYLIYKKRQFPDPTIQNFISITKRLIARASIQDEIWE